MAGLGIGLMWGAYTLGLYGYCLIKGYDITLLQLLKPTWPPVSTIKAGGKIASPGSTVPDPGTPPTVST